MSRAEERLAILVATDAAYWADGLTVAGIDEVGRGPLAGSVVSGCVVLPQTPLIIGIDDSKKLSEKKRETLYNQITESAIFAQTGEATVEEIDRLGIAPATRLSMERAAAGAPCDIFLVDAVTNLHLPKPQHGIIHGDALSYAIAAASIFAKVARDRQMRVLDEQYPGYGFANHKGYGTKAHIAAIRTLGPCPLHRRSFLKGIL